MSAIVTPKVYLIHTPDCATALKDLDADSKHSIVFTVTGAFIDAFEGYYLVSELATDREERFCAVPIYDEVIGSFTDKVRDWLVSHGVKIRRIVS